MPLPPATRKTWLTTPTLACLFSTPGRVHTGRPLTHKHSQDWTQVSGTPKSMQSRTWHARSMSPTHMQGWPFMFAFRNMYPGKQSILGSALVYPVSTWIQLSRSIQPTYIQMSKFMESAFQPGIPGGANWFPNWKAEFVKMPNWMYVGWFFLGRWIQVETEQTRQILRRMASRGTCYEKWAWRTNPAWVGNTLLTCRIRICTLFTDWDSGMGVNLLGGSSWMNQSRYGEQACKARRLWSTEPV